MTPEEIGARLVELLGEPAQAGISGGAAWARASVDVPAGRWVDALRAARDDPAMGCDYFDWLSAVDEEDDGFTVVAHLWSVGHRHGLLVRTALPRQDARVGTAVDVFPGAAWHERETHEMFGIAFDGHENLRPLLLPPEFEGHPLRKDFVLASRVAKAWPGAKEPGESDHDTGRARRQPMRPPGVPAPGEWRGEATASSPTEDARRAPERGSAQWRGEATARTSTEDERRAPERGSAQGRGEATASSPTEDAREATASSPTEDERRTPERPEGTEWPDTGGDA